ncbi:hypothetical protein D3C81_1708930 [compost metagenome]
MVLARQKAVVDEEVFFQCQSRIALLQFAGTITAYPVTQGQVLRPRRCPDGIGLDKAQFSDRPHQRGRLEQRTGDRVAAQVVEGEGHGAMMTKTRARVRYDTVPPPYGSGRG